jgi:ferredoxin
MAKIKTEGKEIEVKDGEKIIDACEELGIAISCRSGNCGICRIDIIKGSGNLSELTEEEKELSMDENTRLACQCSIKSGEVKVKF